MRQQTSNFRSCYPSLPCTSPEKTASGPTKKKKKNQTTGTRFSGRRSLFFAAWWGWSPSAWAPNIHCNLPLTWHVHGARKAHSSLPSGRTRDQTRPPMGEVKVGYGFPHLFLKCGKIFCQLGLFCKLVNFFVQCALGDKGNLWNHPALGYNNYMFTNCQGEAVCCYSLGTWQRQFPIHRQGACCD